MNFKQITSYDYAAEFLRLNPNAGIQVGYYGDDEFDQNNCKVLVQWNHNDYIAYLTKYQLTPKNGYAWVRIYPTSFGPTIENAIVGLVGQLNAIVFVS